MAELGRLDDDPGACVLVCWLPGDLWVTLSYGVDPPHCVLLYRDDPGALEVEVKPFGQDSISYVHGYDLEVCLSHIEGLLDGEVDRVHERGGSKKVQRRIELVEDAIAKLTEASEL